VYHGHSMAPSGRKQPSAVRAALGRLLLGHFVAYPIGFLAAVGAIPIGMLVRERALLGASGGARIGIVRDATRKLGLSAIEAAQVEVLLELSLWVALAVVLAIHAGCVPWAIGAARTARNAADPLPERRGRRAFVIVTLALALLVGLAALAGWIWVFTL
jgi:hypothetical protein